MTPRQIQPEPQEQDGSSSESSSRRPYTLTPAARQQRSEASRKHGAYATASASRLRQRRTRRKVRTLKSQFPHLATAPDHLLQRYAEVDLICAKVFAALVDDDVTTVAGEPRKLLGEYRLLQAELRTLAEALGMLKPAGSDPLSDLLGGK